MLRRRLHVLRWAAPLALFALTVLYQLGPARWLETAYGPPYRLGGELLFFGAIGPLLAWLLVEMLSRWLDERETSDLQASLLAQARQAARIKDETSDTALQKLYAANLLIQSLSADSHLLSPHVSDQLRTAHQALEDALNDLSAGPSFPP